MSKASAYVACVPHVPLLSMQDHTVNADFWKAYDARIEELKAFDPELVIVFGGDHYDALFLKLMPTIVVAQKARGMSDCGGYAGQLNVPMDIAYACAENLIQEGFDIATSYDLELDHGFTNVLHHFLGSLDGRPVLPILVNAMCNPKPTYRRVRQLGEAVGRFAATLGKRVAFLGSGGLSHQTNQYFPQYNTAPNETVREFLVHGNAPGMSLNKWMSDVQHGMDDLSARLVDGRFKAPWINKAWDMTFLDTFGSGDMTRFDSWTCQEVTEAGGYGAGEIRQWIAAAAAAKELGVQQCEVDYYSDKTTLAVGAAVAHGSTSSRS